MANKIFDDIFRTMCQKMSELLVPVINEAFGTVYTENDELVMLPNEHNKASGEIITDALVKIAGHLYHIECQSTKDNQMILRMFAYDLAIALEEAYRSQNAYPEEKIYRTENRHRENEVDRTGNQHREDEAYRAGKVYRMEFPGSCVVYLRPGHANIKNEELLLTFPNGASVPYTVTAIEVQEYSIEELFEKGLLMFLPFYILRYEKEIKRELKAGRTVRQQIIDELQEIADRLAAFLNDEKTAHYTVDLHKYVVSIIDHVVSSTEEKERFYKAMGGEILELESERLIRLGREEEQKNTERERQAKERERQAKEREQERADAAETRADEAEKQLAEYIRKYGLLD